MPRGRKKAPVSSSNEVPVTTNPVVPSENEEVQKPLPPVQVLLLKASQGSSHHGDLLNKITDLYLKMETDEFFQQFIIGLAPFLGYGKKSVQVTQALNFVTKFVCKLWKEYALRPDEDDPSIEICCPFLYKLLDVLFQAPYYKVDTRFRICELLWRILENMSADVNIEMAVWEELEKCLLLCASDVSSGVRMQAMNALKRLQFALDEDCEVTKTYIWHLKYDINVSVKMAAINCISPSNRVIKIMLESTRETNVEVAKAAFKYIMNRYHIKALSIAQRVELLNRGFHHKDESIVDLVKNELLVVWLNLVNNDITELLLSVDAADCDTLAIEALNALFNKDMSLDKVVKDFKASCSPDGETRLISLESITPEKAIYWYSVCEYLRKQNAINHLDEVLPDLPVLCKYIARCVEDQECLTAVEYQISWECLCIYLLKMLSLCDVVDAYGRQKCLDLSEFLLKCKRVEGPMIPSVMKVIEKAVPDVIERIRMVLVTIADIKEPLATENDDEKVKPMSEEELRHLKYEIMKLSNQMHTIQDDIDESVAVQDFVRAQQMKEDLDKVQEEKNKLQATFDVQSSLQVPQENEADNENPPVQAAVRVEDIEKCLDVVFELLQSESIIELRQHDPDNSLQRFMEADIRSNILNPFTPRVLKAAVRALGACCIHDLDSAKKFFPNICTVCEMDEDSVREVCITAIMDLLLLYGTEPFDISEDSDLFSMLHQQLYSPYAPLRKTTAVGFAKLLLFERIPTADTVVHLLMLWFKPAPGDLAVKQALGVFFQAYVSQKQENQRRLQEVFMRTVMQIHDDMAIHMDLEEVIKYFVYLTDEKRLQEAQNYRDGDDFNTTKTSSVGSQDHSVHLLLVDDIVKGLAEAEPEDQTFMRALVSGLKYLNLGTDFNPRFDDYKAELEKIMQKLEINKTALKELKKWETGLDKLIKKRKDNMPVVPETPQKRNSIVEETQVVDSTTSGETIIEETQDVNSTANTGDTDATTNNEECTTVTEEAMDTENETLVNSVAEATLGTTVNSGEPETTLNHET